MFVRAQRAAIFSIARPRRHPLGHQRRGRQARHHGSAGGSVRTLAERHRRAGRDDRRDAREPLWPALEATAHTLVYDSFIPGSLPPDRLAAIGTPALVLGSEGSDDRLRTWVQGVAEALPNASARFLPGTWHGVSPEHLAPALTEFFTGR